MLRSLLALGPRTIHCLLVAATVSYLLVAMYMEHAMGLEPCPLCIFQRVGVIAVGIVALIALIHNPATFGQTIYSAFGISACVITIGIAARQLWLQSLPADQVPACGPSLNYLMDVFPLMDVLQMVLAGDGSCAEVSWQLLGISIPGWVVIGCIPLLIGNLLVLHRQ